MNHKEKKPKHNTTVQNTKQNKLRTLWEPRHGDTRTTGHCSMKGWLIRLCPNAEGDELLKSSSWMYMQFKSFKWFCRKTEVKNFVLFLFWVIQVCKPAMCEKMNISLHTVIHECGFKLVQHLPPFSTYITGSQQVKLPASLLLLKRFFLTRLRFPGSILT